jgi:fibronectin type 3 domain-containing protein
MPGSGESIIEAGHYPFLQAPSNFTLLSAVAGANQVTLTWSPSGKATNYLVEYGTSSGTYSTMFGSCSGAITSCSVTGLNANQVYYFKVTASNTIGLVVAANELSATPIDAFSLSGATISSGQASISFAMAAGATSYTVQYGTVSGFYPSVFTTTATASPVSVTGLTNGVSYYFRVVAVNSSGFVNSTNELSAMPQGTASVPTSLAATSSVPGVINLSWAAASGGGIGYIVRRSLNLGGPYSDLATGLNTNTLVDSSATPGLVYYYVVAAVNAGGTSANSNEVSVTSIQGFAISSYSVTSSSVTLNWNTLTEAQNYTVKQSNLIGQSYIGNNVTGCVNITVGSCTISGLSAGSTYYFTVVAQNTGVSSTALSNATEVAATPLFLPFTSAISGSGSIQFQWTAVPLATGYTIYYSNSPGQAATSGTPLAGCGGLNSSATSCTGTGLTNGSQYYFSMRASLSSGGVYNSSEVMGIPIANFNLNSVTVLSSSSVRVSWNATTGATNYNVIYGNTDGGAWAYSGCSTSILQCDITGLSAGSTYYFMVVATNAYGSVQASGSNLSQTMPVTAAAPTSLVASAATANQIGLSWTASATGTAPLTYTVFRSTSSGSGYTALSTCTGVSVTNCQDTILTLGQQYYYVVAATNSGGTSGYSNQATQIAMSPFSITTLVRATNKMTLSWSSSTGADHYVVQYGSSTGSYSTTFSSSAVSGIDVTGLSGISNYYFMVKAVNLVNAGAASTINSTVEASAKLLQVADQIDDDNTSAGFQGGAFSGVQWGIDSTNTFNVLRLNTAVNSAELDSSWTPQWSNIVGYWKLNEASGATSVVDYSGKGNTGTPANVTFAQTGKLNKSALFSSANSTISVGAGNGFSAVKGTILAWVKPSGYTNANGYNKELFFNGSPNPYRIYFGRLIPSGNLTFSLGDVNLFDSGYLVPAGTWSHVAMTWQESGIAGAGTVWLYVNGDLVFTSTYTGLLGLGGGPQIGSFGPSNSSFEGLLDEVSIFSASMTPAEVATVFNRQSAAYTGTFTSRKMDAWSSQSWTSLSAVTSLPFYKELPALGSSEASSSYAAQSANLTNGLVGLWRFNETSGTTGSNSIKDSSGKGHHGTPSNMSLGKLGVLGSAAYFNGVNSTVMVPYTSDYDFVSGDFTASAWIYPNKSAMGVSNLRIFDKGDKSWVIYLDSGAGLIALGKTNIGGQVFSSVPIAIRAWSLVTATVSGATRKLYINGQDVTTVANAGLPYESNSGSLNIGSAGDGTRVFNGMIDEATIWSRALTAAEVLELYRRGANRIKYQVRTCANSNCSDQDALTSNYLGWKGPDNTGASYFSELYNTTGNALDGVVNAGLPLMTFSNFINSPPTVPSLSISNNQYFQYRAIFESDDTTTSRCSYDGGTTGASCSPELRSVEVGPGHTDLPIQINY